MNTIKRIYVEKRPGFDVEAQGLYQDLKDNLRILPLKGLRILYRYDIQGIENEIFERAKGTVFSDPPVDFLYIESHDVAEDEVPFGIEYLPGQYDQRADSASQCLQLISQADAPPVTTAKIILLTVKLI